MGGVPNGWMRIILCVDGDWRRRKALGMVLGGLWGWGWCCGVFMFMLFAGPGWKPNPFVGLGPGGEVLLLKVFWALYGGGGGGG